MDLLALSRKIFTDKSTIGDLYFDNEFFCSTLELSCRRVNPHGHLAIPPGHYRVVLDYSPKFKRNMPRLINVPGREGILIHWANFPEDLEGCIGVGVHTPEMAADFIGSSRKTFDQLYEKLQAREKEEIWIAVSGGFRATVP